MLTKLKYYFVVGLVCLGIGYFAKPHPVKIETKTEIVEKIVTKVVYQKAAAAKKVKVVVKNKDGSSVSTETTNTNSLTNSESNQIADVKAKEVTIQKYLSWGVGLLADFDKNNKYEGSNLDAHYGYGKAKIDLDEQTKYNGWGIGIQVNF